MKTLELFWQWCDAEKPSRKLFEEKLSHGGPLSLQARDAIHAAVDATHADIGEYDCLVSMRAVVKELSFAILRANQHAESQEVKDEVDALNKERAIEIKARFDERNLGLVMAYGMGPTKLADMVRGNVETHIRGTWDIDGTAESGDVLCYHHEVGLGWKKPKS